MSLLNDTHVKDIIIFGTGKIGQEVVHLLERKHHILFAVDNDKTKWGKTFEGYIIKAPYEISGCNQDIVIVSTKYLMDISLQLIHMGISREKIFYCNTELINGAKEYVFYPLDAEKIADTGKSLIQYDLLGEKEQETDNKKVLIFCSSYSVYIKQLIENISKRYKDIEFSILTKAEENKDKITAECLRHIYIFQTKSDLKTILEQLPVYDDMHLLWMENEWSYFYELIRKKTRHLILNIGGSDFYRASSVERDIKNSLIECADKIMAQTPETAREFKLYYKDICSNKVQVLPYGVEVLDFIKQKKNSNRDEIRKKYHILTNKIIVTCGHNGTEAHQHIDMLDAINKLPEDVKKKIVCVVPMTYPSKNETYIGKVGNKLNEIGIEHLILTDFMDFQAMAEYALISDIMIHVQTTDQLSSAMLEEMYAGSVVIAGSWLPYKALRTEGIYFIDIDRIDDLTTILEEVVVNIEEYKEKCRNNKEIVWKHSSWDELAPMWHALWK